MAGQSKIPSRYGGGGVAGAVTKKTAPVREIIVNDKNDPRLQAYQDSLQLYKSGESNFDRYKTFIKNNNIPEKSTRSWNNPVTFDGDNYAEIQPTKGLGFYYNHNPDVFSDTNIPSSTFPANTNRYKKPTQPVKYQPKPIDPAIVAKQKQLKDQGLYQGELDGVWGAKSQAAWDTYSAEQAKKAESAKKYAELKASGKLDKKPITPVSHYNPAPYRSNMGQMENKPVIHARGGTVNDNPSVFNGITIWGDTLKYNASKPLPASKRQEYITAGELASSLHDADTYYQNTGRRLAVIDAPEMDQEWGEFARAEALDIVSGIPSDTRLKVNYYGKDYQGKGNRELTEVFLPDGQTLSHKLLKRGVGMGTWNYDTKSDALIKKAMDNHIGMYLPFHPLTQNELRAPNVHRAIAKGKNFANVPDRIDASPETQRAYVSAKKKAFADYKLKSFEGSIYDHFLTAGLNPSYGFREKAFKGLGYGNYKGTAEQNKLLLKAVREKKITKDAIIDTVYALPKFKKGGMIQVNGHTGEEETVLEGGERIFSRPDTASIVNQAKECKDEKDLAKLGKTVYGAIKSQDRRKPEYVKE